MIDDVLAGRLAALQEEANGILAEKEQAVKRVQTIDVRLHQIVGAINELQNIEAEVNKAKEPPKTDSPKKKGKNAKKEDWADEETVITEPSHPQNRPVLELEG